MLAWGDLIEGPAPLLRVVGMPVADRAATERVLLAREPGPAGTAEAVGPAEAAGALVVAGRSAGCLEPGRAGALSGAAGVVVVGDDAVAERVARSLAVPVFVPAAGVAAGAGAAEVWGLLLERDAATAAARAARAEALVARAEALVAVVARGAGDSWTAPTSGGSAAAGPSGASGIAWDAVERLARWCAEQVTDARVRIVPPDADLAEFGPAGREMAALARGRVRGPVHVPGGVAVAGGRRYPRPVLVAERDAAWNADELLFLEQVAACAGLLAWAADVGARDARLTEAGRELKVAALQQLMAGDLVRAGRTVEPLVPGLVAAGSGAVAIVECAPGESRTALARAVEHAVLRQTLTVLCPVSDRQVIVIHPTGAGALDVLLGPVISEVWGRSAGVSAVTPWPRTAAAYESAVAALAAARGTPDRITVHDGRAPLSERLGPNARIWAALVTEPLAQLPLAEREELIRLGEQTLWWGESAGARLVGWHRHTLARRLDALGRHTGLDPSDPWQRTALYLAVRLNAPPRPDALDPSMTLARALDEPDARAWAHEVLAPLPPPIRRTLATWVTHGMRPTAATAALSLSRTTLYKHLARAAELTHLEFTRHPGPAAEITLALHLTGDLRIPGADRTPRP